MKKILILFVLIFSLSSCFWSTSNQDIEKAKNDALNWIVDNNLKETWKIENDDLKENDNKLEEDKKTNYIEIKNIGSEKFIEIDNFDVSNISNLEKEVTWKTLVHVDKIQVSYTNLTTWAKDDFELKKFKSWDKEFLFRAFKKYDTLDYWENIFIVSAYSWESVSKTELKIFLQNNNSEDISKIENKEIVVWDLPVSAIYWNPVEIWNGKYTYSDVKWLEFENIWDVSLSNDTDSITNFLSSKYKNIFYWNTKRPISGDKWLSFFVVRVSWDKYFYEKHYYVSPYYWVLSLEEWDFTSEWDILEKTKKLSELNLTLKEKNNSYQMVKISDILFQSFKK